jgi:hypothetical protein
LSSQWWLYAGLPRSFRSVSLTQTDSNGLYWGGDSFAPSLDEIKGINEICSTEAFEFLAFLKANKIKIFYLGKETGFWYVYLTVIEIYRRH